MRPKRLDNRCWKAERTNCGYRGSGVCREVRRQVYRGQSPRVTNGKAGATFKELVEQWTKEEQIGAKQNASADRTQVAVLNSCERWHDWPACSITDDDVRKLLLHVRDDRAAPYMANRLFTHLRTFFNWCVEYKHLAASPMQGVKKPFKKERGRKREWFAGPAGDDAVRKVWHAADVIGGDGGKLLKLVLITGKRRGAIERMRWQEIGADWYWHAPEGSHTKRLHPMPSPTNADATR